MSGYENLPEGVKLLGVELDYNLNGATCDRETLVALLTAAGFGRSVPRNPPTIKRALRRAIAEWAQARAGVAFADDEDRGEMTRRKQLIRSITGEAKRGGAAPTVFALVEEASLGGQLGLKYATSYRFHYQPEVADNEGENAGTLRVTSSARGAIETGELEELREQIMPIWDRYKGLYLGADLSVVLIDTIHSLRGISVQAGSGVWFVPADKLAEVDRIETLIRGFGGQVRIRENIDWPRTRQALSEAAFDALVSEIRAAEQALERFEEQAGAKPGSVKPTSVAGLMQDLIRVKKKAAFYEETVGMRSQRLVTDLNALGSRTVTLTKVNQAARQQRAGVAPALPLSDAPPPVPVLPVSVAVTRSQATPDMQGVRERRFA